MKRATINDAPAVLNTNDKAMWVLGYNAALDAMPVQATFGSPEPRPPCTVCGTPYAEHGTYPTCATHPYTADGNCQHVIGAACVGAECRNGCVRASGVLGTFNDQQEKRDAP